MLVVEDAPDNQLLIRRLLTREGALVDVAGDGAEGVERAGGAEYDVIVMDIQMPRLDGYAATRCLRAQGFGKPIIALSAHAMPEDQQKAHAAGFDEHLAKPIDRERLLAAVARLVRGA